MITRRFVLTGLIAAPAVIATEKLMAVHSLPKPYATVWGVGWDLEVVEHQVWTQQDALNFARFGIGGIDKFREITDIVYGFKMPPLPEVSKRSWYPDYQFDPMARYDKPVDDSQGVTNIVTFDQLGKWQESQRPELGSRYGEEWAKEVMRTNEANGLPKYDGVNWKWYPKNLGI